MATTSPTVEPFRTADGAFEMPVRFGEETAWLTQAQMAELFGKDRSVIAKHIKNAADEREIDLKEACAKFAHTTQHGAIVGKTQVHEVVAYNLDVAISVGYRVHSQRGVEFRKWATRVLREYITKGYVANRQRLAQLGMAVEVMKRISNPDGEVLGCVVRAPLT